MTNFVRGAGSRVVCDMPLSRRRGSTLHEGELTEIDTLVAGGHAFGRHLQQDAYAANLARKDQEVEIYQRHCT